MSFFQRLFGKNSGRDFIPPEFRFGHELSYFLHDNMVNALVSGEQSQIFQAEFEPRPGEAEQIAALEGDDLWEWLEKNGYQHVIDEVSYRQISAALLSDF